jgi:Putative DNA-binding domain
MLTLRELQARFAAALAPTAGPDPVLLALVRSAGALTPADRVEIYADMYRARLVDVLREDFPRTRGLLGDAAFVALAERYLARHPSTHPSVRYVGARFADFVAGQTAGPPWLADLARLEWARVEVFDAPDAEPLGLADLQAVPPADWPALRLRLVPACRVVESPWPIHEIWTAGDPDSDQPVPDTPRTSVVRVWREGFSVSHAAMGDAERRAFAQLQRGEPFASLCAALEGDLDAEAAARQAGALLMRWLEDELLARGPVTCGDS